VSLVPCTLNSTRADATSCPFSTRFNYHDPLKSAARLTPVHTTNANRIIFCMTTGHRGRANCCGTRHLAWDKCISRTSQTIPA
jgi:hypothetical protein